MSGQRPKVRKTQLVRMLNIFDEEDSGKSDAEDQENNCDWDLSVSEEELSNEDEVENVPDLSATNDAINSLIVTSNSDQSPVYCNV